MQKPIDVERYRDATQRQRMPGVMSPSFVCPRCKVVRKTAGRKMVVKGQPRYGWICKECASG